MAINKKPQNMRVLGFCSLKNKIYLKNMLNFYLLHNKNNNLTFNVVYNLVKTKV
ncbi:hypothetical protein GCM10023311_21540 [Flaviramulus aquimarinus]|uniref:Uncharacterized protein n=1 Tax=Flaviramulus aquimarinus TaxID=1170456 RepID=A0ABP9F8S6_9FLAO